MKILLVEDDERIASFTIKGLQQAGFVVDHASDGETGLELARNEDYAVAVVDIMLPRLDGLSLVENVRRGKIQTPIIFVSAKGTVEDRIKGLQIGADDYLAKPFAFSELLARIQALIRRANSIVEPTTLGIADLNLDLIRRKVWRADKEIEMQAKEFALLEYLLRNKGAVVSKTMIIENVWDYNFDPQTNIVEARMCRLRDKVDRGFDRKLIHTLRGIGYKIE